MWKSAPGVKPQVVTGVRGGEAEPGSHRWAQIVLVCPGNRPFRAGKRCRCAVRVKGRCPRSAHPAPLGTVGGTPGP